jgi:hypothetical protein
VVRQSNFTMLLVEMHNFSDYKRICIFRDF